jgi:hypothetical protein
VVCSGSSIETNGVEAWFKGQGSSKEGQARLGYQTRGMTLYGAFAGDYRGFWFCSRWASGENELQQHTR